MAVTTALYSSIYARSIIDMMRANFRKFGTRIKKMYLSNVGMGNSVRGRLVELVAGVVRLHLVLGNYFNLLRYKI